MCRLGCGTASCCGPMSTGLRTMVRTPCCCRASRTTRTPTSTRSRPDVLSYTSAVLDAPYTVIGTLWMTLFVASSAADTDFVARLVDVYPDGRAINLADGIIRLSCRAGYPAAGRIELERAVSVTPGTAYKLCIDLQAAAVTFLPRYRIRIDVTSSSHPRSIRH